jgi:hydroxymethylpyrimidine/phosphomethylpyrimidine kinase
MLAAADTIEMVARVVSKHKIPTLIIDPVCHVLSQLSSSTSHRFQ